MKGFDDEGNYPLGDIRLNFFLVLTVRALREGEVVSCLELSSSMMPLVCFPQLLTDEMWDLITRG